MQGRQSHNFFAKTIDILRRNKKEIIDFKDAKLGVFYSVTSRSKVHSQDTNFRQSEATVLNVGVEKHLNNYIILSIL